jgi:DoxX-like family
MSTAYFIVTVIAVAANAGAAAADLARADFVLANSAKVGVSRSWLPVLATLKAAGAAGLVFGLIGVRAIGLAAASGLVAFFIGAIAAHLRARAFHTIAFPGIYLALAIASMALGRRQ